MFSDIFTFDKHCEKAFETKVKVNFKPDKIILCGMGGSAIMGDIASALVEKIPLIVVRGYDLPKYADKNSLVIISSYSGDTEETLSCFEQARKRKLKVVAITSGGSILSKCKKGKVPFIQLPTGYQPRAALGYGLFSLLGLLQNSEIISVKLDAKEAIKLVKKNKPIMEIAHKMASNLTMSVPVIYASSTYYGVAMRWKTQVNENAKQMAFFNVFSEQNHNEINGYQFVPPNFHVVLLRDKKDSARIRKRMDILKPAMSKTHLTEVYCKGKSLLARILYLIHLGDWVSYYLASFNQVDPTPVPVIDNLKIKLKK